MRDQLCASIDLWLARRETAEARRIHAEDMLRVAIEGLREIDDAPKEAVFNANTKTFNPVPARPVLRPTPVSSTTQTSQSTGTDA